MQRLFHVDGRFRGRLSASRPGGSRLRGALRPETLRAAWDDVLARHAILRTAYVDGRAPASRCRSSCAASTRRWQRGGLARTAAGGAGPPARRARARRSRAPLRPRAAAADAPRPACGSTRTRWELLWSTHHLHVDGWSWPLIFRDLSALYEARRTGARPRAGPGLPVPPLPRPGCRSLRPIPRPSGVRGWPASASPRGCSPAEGPFTCRRRRGFRRTSSRALSAEATDAPAGAGPRPQGHAEHARARGVGPPARPLERRART